MRNTRGWESWEAHVNDELGLEPTVGSGNQFYDKGDGVDRTHYLETEWAYQVDAKFTERGSFPVQGHLLDQMSRRALMAGKRFALAVRVWRKEVPEPSDYVVLSLSDFSEMLERLKESERGSIAR